MTNSNGHESRAHARFNFSGAHRWLNCEGSIALSEKAPEQAPSPYAKKGTLQHEANEKALIQFLQYKQTGTGDYPQWSIESDESCEFDAEQAVEISKLYVKLVWEKALEQALTGKAYALEDKLILNKDLDLWGTADFWAVYINDKAKRTAIFIDYKNGHYPVEVRKNPQIMAYACALRAELRRHGKDLDTVRTAIIQPNANCEPYRECSYTAKQLDVFEKKLYKKVNAILSAKKPKYKVGDWCTFCPAMALCGAYKKSLEEKQMLPSLKDNALPDVEKLSDGELSQIALHADRLEEFLKAVKTYIINRHIKGAPVAGCKVVEKNGKRGWIKDEEKIAKTLKDKGLEPYREKLITITEAKKKLTDEDLHELTELGKSSYIVIAPEDERPSAQSATDLLT